MVNGIGSSFGDYFLPLFLHVMGERGWTEREGGGMVPFGIYEKGK